MGALTMFLRVGSKAHYEALRELFVITLISLAPIGFGGLIRSLRPQNNLASIEGYWHAVDSLLERGELFMCALAFVAVIAWHVFKEWPKDLNPPRATFGIYCLLSFAVITIFYTLDANQVEVHVDFVLVFSKLLFAATLFVYYLSTVLTKFDLPDLASELAQSSEMLSSELKRRKK